VIILDEPANGLDPKARVEMRDLLLHLAAMGKTLLVTSHILPELARICDSVAILSQGKLQAFGTLETIMQNVSSSRLLEIQLSNKTQLDEANKILTKLTSDKDELNVATAEASIRLKTNLAEEKWCELLTALVNQGVQVSQFREIQTDLEDAYLTVTEASMSNEKGAATSV